MIAKKNGASPDKRRKYDAAFKAEAMGRVGESRSTQVAARALAINPKLLYRWQQAQVGSVKVARDPEVRALRAANKRLAPEVDISKKLWSSLANRLREYVVLHCSTAGIRVRLATLLGVAGNF